MGKGKGRGKAVSRAELLSQTRRDEEEGGRRTTFLSTDDESDDDDDDDGEGELDGEMEEEREEGYNIENDPEYIAFLKSGKTREDVFREIREAAKDDEDEPTDDEATHPGQLDMRVGEIIVAAKHSRADQAEQTVEYVELGGYCEDLLLSSPLTNRYEHNMKELQGKKVVVVVNADPYDKHWVKSKTAMMLLTCEEAKKPKRQHDPFSIRSIVEEIRAENPELIEELQTGIRHDKNYTEEDLLSDKEQAGNLIPSEKEDIQNPSASEEIQESLPAEKEEVQVSHENEDTEQPVPDKQEVSTEKSLSPELDEMVTLYEPIEVPHDSVPGSRVYFDGYANEPLPYCDQQLFEYVLRGFRVDNEGLVFYKDNKPLLVEVPENSEPKKAFVQSIREAPVVLN